MTTDERSRVLQMIQRGEISAEEGAEMLDALGTSAPAEAPAPAAPPATPRQFRIRVTDLRTGRQKVDISLPWNLINVAVKMGARFSLDEVRIEDLRDAVQAGAEGKLMDVVDEAGGERVEIFVK